ncbi:hypothetical protein P8605_38370 [Streptomyces sp. T-3]|nr:hypothetical protein [Streptomyces sp. T-3]
MKRTDSTKTSCPDCKRCRSGPLLNAARSTVHLGARIVAAVTILDMPPPDQYCRTCDHRWGLHDTEPDDAPA